MKTRKRRQDPDAEYNFWQPATDMMSALVYVLLLIIALLGLYLLSDYTGLEEPSSSSEEAASSVWVTATSATGVGLLVNAAIVLL